MKRALIYGICALGLFWGCSKEDSNDSGNTGEPGFSFKVKGEGIDKTLSGNSIVFNSTTIDAKDIDNNDIQINTVVIIAQVPKGDTVEEVLISITDRTRVESGSHPIGTDIFENYNAFASYWADNKAGFTFKASDGAINLKTRTDSQVAGSLNVSGGGGSIVGDFTAPSQ